MVQSRDWESHFDQSTHSQAGQKYGVFLLLKLYKNVWDWKGQSSIYLLKNIYNIQTGDVKILVRSEKSVAPALNNYLCFIVVRINLLKLQKSIKYFTKRYSRDHRVIGQFLKVVSIFFPKWRKLGFSAILFYSTLYLFYDIYRLWFVPVHCQLCSPLCSSLCSSRTRLQVRTEVHSGFPSILTRTLIRLPSSSNIRSCNTNQIVQNKNSTKRLISNRGPKWNTFIWVKI